MKRKANYNNRKQTGDIAEDAVKYWLNSQDFIVYEVSQNDKEQAHPFDGIATEVSGKCLFFFDSKCKPKMIRYNATGFDLQNYETYKSIAKKRNTQFVIFWVDYEEGKIYGNDIDSLDKPFTDSQGVQYPFNIMKNETNGLTEDVRVFSRENMNKHLESNLSESDIQVLRQLNDSEFRRVHEAYTNKVHKERAEIKKKEEEKELLSKFTE